MEVNNSRYWREQGITFSLILGPTNDRDLRGFCLFIFGMCWNIGKRIRSDVMSCSGRLLSRIIQSSPVTYGRHSIFADLNSVEIYSNRIYL
jgi:ribosome biogenesis protein Tsr3